MAQSKEFACNTWVLQTWVQHLGQEDPLEKGMATHSSILTWRIPWTEGRVLKILKPSLKKASLQDCHRGMEWVGRWDRGSGWGGRMYTYGGFIVKYEKSHHNIAKYYSPITINK